MNLANGPSWKASLLDHRNGGESTGDPDQETAGGAGNPTPEPGPAACTEAEQRFLMDLARRTIQEVVTRGTMPDVEESQVPEKLRLKKGCFVTLTQQGRLRGCIGHLVPQEALYRAVMHNTRSAAIHDGRFPRVTPDELTDLRLEISILTEPQPLAFSSAEDLLSKLRPRLDGVVLRLAGRSATFLPQVWEQVSDRQEFLNRLAMKAGGAPSDWRQPGAMVSTYQVEAFHEGTVGGSVEALKR